MSFITCKHSTARKEERNLVLRYKIVIKNMGTIYIEGLHQHTESSEIRQVGLMTHAR